MNATRIRQRFAATICVCLLTGGLLGGCRMDADLPCATTTSVSDSSDAMSSLMVLVPNVLSTTRVESRQLEDDFSGKIVRSVSELDALQLDERVPTAEYTENYFVDKALVVFHVRFSSGSTYFSKIDAALVEKDTGCMTVVFETIRPTPFTNDLAYWCVLLEFAKEDVEGVRQIVQQRHQVTQSSTQTPPAGNDGQMVYYVPGGGVYQNNPGAAQDILLASSKDPFALCEIGDYVYYAVQSELDSFTLYRVLRKGNLAETVVEQRDLPHAEYGQLNRWEMRDGNVYIHMNGPLYRYDVESDKAQLLQEDIAKYAILDNNLYYIEHASRTFTVYRMDLSTGKSMILLGDGIYDGKKTDKTLYKNLCVAENALYVATRQPTGIYRYENGTSLPIYEEDSIDEFSVTAYDERVYFVTHKDENGQLMEYSPQTHAVKKIADISDYNRTVTIQDGQFYYVSSKKIETTYATIPLP